jgi:predicted RNase H-related nuclease YkuK (DUF458 family)
MLQPALDDRPARLDSSGSVVILTPWEISASVTLKSGASNICDVTKDAKATKMRDRIAIEVERGICVSSPLSQRVSTEI